MNISKIECTSSQIPWWIFPQRTFPVISLVKHKILSLQWREELMIQAFLQNGISKSKKLGEERKKSALLMQPWLVSDSAEERTKKIKANLPTKVAMASVTFKGSFSRNKVEHTLTKMAGKIFAWNIVPLLRQRIVFLLQQWQNTLEVWFMVAWWVFTICF